MVSPHNARSPSEADAQVGRSVERARLKRGVSRLSLSGMIGVSVQQLAKYEKGTNRIAVSRLRAIAEALGTEVTDLHPDAALDKGASDERSEWTPDPSRVAQGLQLTRAFVRIEDPSVRRRVIALVESMAETY